MSSDDQIRYKREMNELFTNEQGIKSTDMHVKKKRASPSPIVSPSKSAEKSSKSPAKTDQIKVSNTTQSTMSKFVTSQKSKSAKR